MEEQKSILNPTTFVLKKTTSGGVVFSLPNPYGQRKTIFLNNAHPAVKLSADMVVALFTDDDAYSLYHNGYITFTDNKAALKVAQENNAYFDDELDFTPATEDKLQVILETLKAGKRQDIINACVKYGASEVQKVATEHIDELSNAVTNMLEKQWGVQLRVDVAG